MPVETFKTDVQNVLPDHEKYIVAKVYMGTLWYWGSWSDKVDAERVAEELGNAVVLEEI